MTSAAAESGLPAMALWASSSSSITPTIEAMSRRTSKGAPAHLAPTGRDRRRGGRYSTYTEKIGREICRRLSIGDLLVEICANPPMPTLVTLIDWRRRYPEFASLYAHAREEQGYAVAERAVRSGRAATAEDAAAARVRFDADRWFASKLLPKVFGDRVEHTGSVDVSIGLADRLDAARKRLAQAAAGAVIEGVALRAAAQPGADAGADVADAKRVVEDDGGGAVVDGHRPGRSAARW